MNAELLGKNSSSVEVQNISLHGVWLWVMGKEYFLSYQSFPWFRKAPLEQVFNVELHHKKNLHWPDLDIDLSLATLEYPEHYPLISL